MNLDNFEMIFWDFDGVIKDSIEAKTDAFVELFKPYGETVCKKVYDHHVSNGGMSRYGKMPIYLKWANEEVTEIKVNKLCNEFGNIVKSKVVNSPWVPGVERYLRNNPYQQTFVLVSATPQKEMEEIMDEINLTNSFVSIFGYPISKKNAIQKTLINQSISKEKCLMIGDAKVDYDAATDTNISFLFRRHNLNKKIFVGYKKDLVHDFNFI